MEIETEWGVCVRSVPFCVADLSSPSWGCHSPGSWPRSTLSICSKDCDGYASWPPRCSWDSSAFPCVRSCTPVFPFGPLFWICLFPISLQFLFGLHPFRPSPTLLPSFFFISYALIYIGIPVVSVIHNLKFLIENFRYKQFINLQVVCCWCVMKSCIFLIHSAQDMNHPCIQYPCCISYLTISHLYCPIYWCGVGNACVQVTLIFLNNGPETQE